MATIEVHNPATLERIGEVPVTGPDAVRAAIERARAAQAAWAARPLAERCALLQRAKDGLIARTDEVARHLVREMGKTATEAISMEILPLVSLMDYFAREAPRILAPEPIPIRILRHKASYLHFPPRGVVGVISPWNFPLSLAAGPAAMALVAGNAVVLKPSEFTPLTGDLVREILVEGGIPEDLVQVVHGAGPTGAALVTGGVDMVVFTGSVATGRKVAAAAGERLVPCVTELGGKAPALVTRGADLERTAHALRWGAFANAGQVCASVERIVVHEDRHDALVERLLELAGEIVVGDPARPETQMGPLNNARQLAKVRELVEDARERGATVHQPAQAPQGPGHFFPPTVVTGVTPDMRIWREEIFGPVVTVTAAPDVDRMVELANDSHLGLLAYVFDDRKERARAVAERVVAGTVMINDVLSTHGLPETPWGGLKDSGIGHTHSDQGLRDLCQQRHVHYDLVNPLKRELWWYPYDAATRRNLERLMGVAFGSGIGRRLKALLGN